MSAVAARAGLAQQTAAPRPVSDKVTASATPGVFVVEPYIQLGDAAAGSATESLSVLWHAADADAGWSVEYRMSGDAAWRSAADPRSRRVALGDVAPHRVYEATLSGLKAGGTVEYRVRKGTEAVFASQVQVRKPGDQPYRFVVFGDCGTSTAGQKAVAYQTYLAQPDFVLITGDIVYNRGRISEYRDKFWPVYNAPAADPAAGAPLLRSTLFVAAPGNHDIQHPSLKDFPDGLAYFLYWSQPMNGPPLKAGAANTPQLEGPEKAQDAFLRAAGAAFPRMASFSFDYGNAHWTILDSNPHADWTDSELRRWVERDLASAGGATWRFVAFHHPGFNSSKKHFSEQRMRRMAETFERGGVDVVFSGHVHNYQRTYPLRFKDKPATAASKRKSSGSNDRVEGRWTLDKTFDGKTRTRPEGIIYLITGAGGASLYDPEQQDDPKSWQEFTDKFLSRTHSLTVAEVHGTTLTVRQVSATGEEIDRFVVTK
jgi:hypothetical protein